MRDKRMRKEEGKSGEYEDITSEREREREEGLSRSLESIDRSGIPKGRRTTIGALR